MLVLLRPWTSTAIYILLPSSLVSFRTEVDGRLSDLRWVQGLVATVAAGDGETHCSKFRSDVVENGTSLRSQVVT
jgi:hypothetical protein